jgi:ABC-type multidrug transport system ATPase subunit
MTILLQVDDLRATYDSGVVLSGINLKVDVGQWTAIIGPNGSGKSTLLACIVGNLALAAGRVLVAGTDMSQNPVIAKQRLGYAVAPELIPRELTGTQCLEVFAKARGLGAVDTVTLTLAEKLHMEDQLGVPVARYSLGNRQKLAALLALVGEPELLVLDEMFNGLDAASKLLFKQHLAERVAAGTLGVVIATHSLDIVHDYCSHAHLLVEGQIAKSWNQGELQKYQNKPTAQFEIAVAAATEFGMATQVSVRANDKI